MHSKNSVWCHAYEPLLRKIALRFGFSFEETEGLLNEVYSFAAVQTESGSASSKVRLSKIMVRKCIFKLSATLFNKNDFYTSQPKHHPGYSLSYNEPRALNFQDMPLSFRAVYILRTDAGFSDEEVAEMLNSTSMQVRERLNKARLFINTYLP